MNSKGKCLKCGERPEENGPATKQPFSFEGRWIPSGFLLPDTDRKVIVHVPEYEKREDADPVVFGRYIEGLDEWRVDGSPSKWDVDLWTEVPRPGGAE